jgi:hypothetical protein
MVPSSVVTLIALPQRLASCERAIQRKLGIGEELRMGCSHISSYMPEKRRVFCMSNISFIPVTILDESG